MQTTTIPSVVHIQKLNILKGNKSKNFIEVLNQHLYS